MRRSSPVTADGYIFTTTVLPIFFDPDGAAGTRRPSLDAVPARPYRDIHLGRSRKRTCPYQDHN
jgi:hypothetical protein